ncbi:MAG: peptide-modifying radical SAM enzyme CbpB [Magnetococcales bacterium]|nr:peptide-modifying radical SAM enzyme CbpB [Magnetococcales bacterium]
MSAEEMASGRLVNSGGGPSLLPWDIGHATHLAVMEPETAFWSLVRKDRLADALTGGELLALYRQKRSAFEQEMALLRFGLSPSAVYFNPTDRCNLDCSYCYIPQAMRQGGEQMSAERLHEALSRLQDYFAGTMARVGRLPRVIFHGAEPLLNFKALRQGIEAFDGRFEFGVQTNATLLTEEMLGFFQDHRVSLGLSLDGPTAEITHDARHAREGRVEVHGAVLRTLEKLRGSRRHSVIVTVTRHNVGVLNEMVELLHGLEVPACLLNMTRCTLEGGRQARVPDHEAAPPFLAALERTHALYRETGRKLVVGNFANILLAILAPTARRLMCDLSPCGGGRAFFAVAANGDLFPCSEFIGLSSFAGGNLFEGGVRAALESPAFAKVIGRDVDRFDPCRRCAIRHFCGSPCPAEAHEMHGGMDRLGAFCAFYEEQTRYAFRLIADGKADDFLWNGWDQGEGMATLLDFAGGV